MSSATRDTNRNCEERHRRTPILIILTIAAATSAGCSASGDQPATSQPAPITSSSAAPVSNPPAPAVSSAGTASLAEWADHVCDVHLYVTQKYIHPAVAAGQSVTVDFTPVIDNVTKARDGADHLPLAGVPVADNLTNTLRASVDAIVPQVLGKLHGTVSNDHDPISDAEALLAAVHPDRDELVQLVRSDPAIGSAFAAVPCRVLLQN
jgi:hypothetical protein